VEARVFSRTRYTFALGAKRSDPEPEASVEHTEVTARIERRAHQAHAHASTGREITRARERGERLEIGRECAVAKAEQRGQRDGARSIHDGPYADTKELLGGYLIIDVPSLDDALVWAERSPSSAVGSTEVRPVTKVSL
jgi:hypothetical protein